MPKTTSRKVAKVASKLLKSKATKPKVKSISASVLTQREKRKPGKEVTSKKVAKLAGKALKGGISKKVKTVSASALSQKQRRR